MQMVKANERNDRQDGVTRPVSVGYARSCRDAEESPPRSWIGTPHSGNLLERIKAG